MSIRPRKIEQACEYVPAGAADVCRFSHGLAGEPELQVLVMLSTATFRVGTWWGIQRSLGIWDIYKHRGVGLCFEVVLFRKQIETWKCLQLRIHSYIVAGINDKT